MNTGPVSDRIAVIGLEISGFSAAGDRAGFMA